MAGRNRAKLGEAILKSQASVQKPCVFLSHVSVDKDSVREIGNYIMRHGDIDIYLDENDAELQKAVDRADPHGITKFIERGIVNSTHVMCFVSKDTSRSWWVPYEIGYGKMASKKLATMKLKGDISIPEYLQITDVIMGTKSLNDYLLKISPGLRKSASVTASMEGILLEHSSTVHPLDNYLDWNK